MVGTDYPVAGNATSLYAVSTRDPTTSRAVSGLPAVSTSQARTVAADPHGDAYVASQFDLGGVQLDRLVRGQNAFSPARTLSNTGTAPAVIALPAGNGAAVAYTENGGDVYVTVQTY